MEDIDENTFEQEAPSNFCSIGWVMDELSEKVSINLIAKKEVHEVGEVQPVPKKMERRVLRCELEEIPRLGRP